MTKDSQKLVRLQITHVGQVGILLAAHLHWDRLQRGKGMLGIDTVGHRGFDGAAIL